MAGIDHVTVLIHYFQGIFIMGSCVIHSKLLLELHFRLFTYFENHLFSLFSLVWASSCHVFIIALQKLKANSVAPAAANNGLVIIIYFLYQA